MTPTRPALALLLGAASCAAALGSGLPAGAETPDAARGRALFQEKRCASCHPGDGKAGMGPPLDAVRGPQGALHFAGRLWNHAPIMFAAFEREGLAWPQLTAEQVADLMAYVQADPSRDPPPNPVQGQLILVRNGCLKCHRLRGEGGSVAIDLTKYQGRYESPAAWAAAIWNHSPRMAGHAARLGLLYPRFSGSEMRHLFDFLRSAAAAAR